MTTPEYNEWWVRRINDNIPKKLETEKLRKGKNKAEGKLDNLKADYKNLRLSMRTAGMGKTSEQWREKFEKKRTKLIDGNRNSKKFRHEMRL
ncbi:hypothetical protein Gotur_024860 [Gossypium turneri]